MEKETVLKLIELMDTDYKKSVHKKSEQYLKAEKMLLERATAKEILIVFEEMESGDYDLFFKAFCERKDADAIVEYIRSDLHIENKDLETLMNCLYRIDCDSECLFEFIEYSKDILGCTKIMPLVNKIVEKADFETLSLTFKLMNKDISATDREKIFNKILETGTIENLTKFIDSNFKNENYKELIPAKKLNYLDFAQIRLLVKQIIDKAQHTYELEEPIMLLRFKIERQQTEKLIKAAIDCAEDGTDAIILARLYCDISLDPVQKKQFLETIDKIGEMEAKAYVVNFGNLEDYDRKIVDPKFLTAEQKGIEEILSSLEETK